MALDDEQRKQVAGCLRKVGIKTDDSLVQKLVTRVESSIGKYEGSEPEPTAASVRKELEDIYSLATREDPPVGLIRTLISKLSEHAAHHIEIRGHLVFPDMFPDYPYLGKFKPWARKLPPAVLVDAVRMIVSTGGKLVVGRSRGKGKRAKAHYAPRIFGTVKGAPDDARRSGRPTKWLEFELVMHLAYDWAMTTSQFPDLRRSDRSGFGDLVHSVFQWCDLSEGEAMYSLRKYSSEVEAIKSDGRLLPLMEEDL